MVKAVHRAPPQWGGVREPYIDGATVSAIRSVFNRTRLAHQNWQSRRMEGRLDSRHVWRYDAANSIDIFRERKNPSPTKLNVFVLVDGSGSMSGSSACNAQDVAATLVDAFKHVPTVRMHVWQHWAEAHGATLLRRYEPGMSLEGLTKMPQTSGGNADNFALRAMGDRAISLARPDTQSLIIMISDGRPSVHGNGATLIDPVAHARKTVADLLRKKVHVMSVAIAPLGGINAEMYGERNVIPFTGDWNELARSFSATFGRFLSEADRVARY
jgi:hypothetical protein